MILRSALALLAAVAVAPMGCVFGHSTPFQPEPRSSCNARRRFVRQRRRRVRGGRFRPGPLTEQVFSVPGHADGPTGLLAPVPKVALFFLSAGRYEKTAALGLHRQFPLNLERRTDLRVAGRDGGHHGGVVDGGQPPGFRRGDGLGERERRLHDLRALERVALGDPRVPQSTEFSPALDAACS